LSIRCSVLDAAAMAALNPKGQRSCLTTARETIADQPLPVSSLPIRETVGVKSSRLRPGVGLGCGLAVFFFSGFAELLFPI